MLPGGSRAQPASAPPRRRSADEFQEIGIIGGDWLNREAKMEIRSGDDVDTTLIGTNRAE